MSFIRALVPFRRALPSWSNYPPKVSPANTISKSVQSIANSKLLDLEQSDSLVTISYYIQMPIQCLCQVISKHLKLPILSILLCLTLSPYQESTNFNVVIQAKAKHHVLYHSILDVSEFYYLKKI